MGREAVAEVRDFSGSLRRRPWWSRMSGSHALAILTAIIAFLLNLVLLRDPELVEVAVARVDIPVGAELRVEDLRWVEVRRDSGLGDSLITRNGFSGLEDRVTRHELLAGDVVLRSSIGPTAAPSSLRAFTVAVETSRAGGGSLHAGDIVDVISTIDGVARYVTVGAEVLAVPEQGERGLAPTTGYFVVLAVDADTALRLAQALDLGRVDVVRSTGAPAPERLSIEPSLPPATVDSTP